MSKECYRKDPVLKTWATGDTAVERHLDHESAKVLKGLIYEEFTAE